ncbi:MAG: Methylglyoxal synthase [Xylophilus sp.]|nr:methylglyoxal synthase [Xylophilus sp.]KAF1050284.1 MAG: Methylglyoxal synthase [Xylophilus sp.]
MTQVRRFGLAAHRLHRQTADGGLARWARSCEAAIRLLGLGIAAVGGCADALERLGLLQGHAGLQCLPYGREGGLMRMVSRIAGGIDPSEELAGAVYLMDPLDPSSLYPEAQALKRQCIVHAKPLLLTVAGAIEWMAVEQARATGVSLRSQAPAGIPALQDQSLALIAHDALKPAMVEFASRHFALLSCARERVATGTTGRRLNEMAWARGWPHGQPWARPLQSGPLGGDAQIAELVLTRRCQKVLFFEDVHVARQHEADIQLLERAVCSASHETACFNTPAMAYAWAQTWS